MSIITFWSNDNIETGQSMSMAAIATYLAIEHNNKILMIDTAENDYTIEDSFWTQKKTDFRFMKQNFDMGLTGLTRLIMSNQKSPEMITHYTRVVFKERLELLTEHKITKEDYERQKKAMKEIVGLANRYYDLVFIDLKGTLDELYIKEILSISNVIVYNFTQRLRNINNLVELRDKERLLKGDNVAFLIGNYNPRAIKYSNRNISRYLRIKKIYTIPFCNLFFEASNEGKIADFFIKFRNIKSTNPNEPFIKSIKEVSEMILNKIEEQQIKRY